MEGIQTIQALKAVQSSLPAQTTIPSDELVMLFATDGTPIAKISRDDLVKAVASVMASNSQNTFSKLLGVQANGTPMGIGASDLASVLGDVLGCKKLTGNATYGEEVAFNSGFRAHIDMIQVSSNVFAVFAVGISRIEKIVDGFGLTSTTKDTPNKYNIYSQNGILYIQNLYSAEATNDVNIVTVGVV